jgi:ubiquinone/menaquinone biosynthesis C-methylase UbiE
VNDPNHAIFEASYRASSYRPKPGYFAELFATRLRTLMRLPAQCRMLDVGCGSGTFLLPLAEAGYRITGLDYSRNILDELCKEAAATGIDPAAFDVVAADARAMPLPDEAFDVVFSFATLYARPDVERVLAEIARVL